MSEATTKYVYVIMKEIRSAWSPWQDVHCVCESRKSAKIECEMRNDRARTNTYSIRRVPLVQLESLAQLKSSRAARGKERAE